MKTILKCVGVCSLTIFLLCLNVNGKPIFESVYSVLSHVTIPFQNVAESWVASAFESTQEYSRKIFQNSLPKVKDSVKSRLAAPARSSGRPAEEILVEEKEQLADLIKHHH